MEVSVQRSDSSGIVEKVKSFDNSSVSSRKFKGVKRSRGFVPVESSRKEASLSSSVQTDVPSVSDSFLNLGCDVALTPVDKNSNGLGDHVVPKRLRGSSRQRKIHTLVDSEMATESSSPVGEAKDEDSLNDRPIDIVSPSQMLTDDRKKKCNRRKKVSVPARQDPLENKAHLADDYEKLYGEEYNVGNLEENAAMMLSSLRFDTRCTGILGNRAASSEQTNGYDGNFNCPADAAGRKLRPRRRSGKNLARKRRHFYEVCSRDVDPYWILQQRIRVFWPLDQSWYFGLVKDYDPVTRRHHVKYDDCDEEWIDLRCERFKLLLFPSEISGKLHTKISQVDLSQKDEEGDQNAFCGSNLGSRLDLSQRNEEDDQNASDGSSLGNSTESEPIISWLARSEHRRKLSSTSTIKKQTKAHILKEFEPSVLLEQECAPVELSAACSELVQAKSRTSSSEAKFVYSRRRFHKRTEGPNLTMEEDDIVGSTAGPISISSAGCPTVPEELNIFSKSVEQKRVVVKLCLPSLSPHNLLFGNKSFSLFHTFFPIQFGVLVHIWPMVRMEIVIVDNIQGLRLLLFEGSLRWVVGLLSSVITVFYRHNKHHKLAKLQMPCTSISFKLSGLHDQGAQLLFVLYNFLQLEIMKWRCFEDKLEQQCLAMWELSTVDCTHPNVKNLLAKSDQILGSSVYKNAVSMQYLEIFANGQNCLESGNCTCASALASEIQLVAKVRNWKFSPSSVDICCSERPLSLFSVLGDPSEWLYSDIMRQMISDKSMSLNTSPSCLIDESYGTIHSRSLSFATSPSVFTSLHLKLLMEGNQSCYGIQKPASSSSHEHANNNNDKLTGDGLFPAEDPADQVSVITNENAGSLRRVIAVPGKPDVTRLKVETDALSFSGNGDWRRSSDKVLASDIDMIVNSNGHSDSGLNKNNEMVVRMERLPGHAESWQDAEKSHSSYSNGSSSEKSEGEYNLCLNNGIQSGDKFAKALHTSSNLSWELNDYTVHCAPRSIWHRNRQNSVSPTFSHRSTFLSDETMQNEFVNQSKKPLTHFAYSFSWSRHNQKARSSKKVKTVNTNTVSGGSVSARSYHQSLSCEANVLVTTGDRGWRESGALVLLDSDDQEWRICVKFSGSMKYECKVQHVLQPGITNRYTHAMMWKGGKDWTLEFTDRSQWALFKEMHEECYNRNMRAAFVKNIPIPGVRLIADADENAVEAPFVRCSSRYYRQVGADVDIALDPSHVLYDMDSGDEEWISEMRNSFDKEGCKMPELTDEMFEKVMDTFEKFAYAQQCDEFTVDEIEEFMAEVGHLEIVKAIYEHWRQKRLENGLPLIRQFQPPLWILYEQQLRGWEFSKSKMLGSYDGFPDNACSIKKPPMFAFCLRPRGLEVPNKGLKQRSHKKFVSAGSHRDIARGHDGSLIAGRRSNGFAAGEKMTIAIPSCESSDSYPSNDGLESCTYPKFYRNDSTERTGMLRSPRDPPTVPFSRNKKFKRDGVCELPRMQQDGLRRNRGDADEFRLRDASNAAKHASKMARLKREKAEWLLHKADLALQKATSALIIADAMKESEDLVL